MDVVTRHYRVRGKEERDQGNKTIFIIPAHAEHPGVKVTREMERTPTVVSVVKPVWLERQTILEMKHRHDLEDLKILKRDSERMKIEKEMDENAKTFLKYEVDIKKGENWRLKKKIEALETALHKPENEARAKLFADYVAKANADIEKANKVKVENEADREATKVARMEAEAARDELRREMAEFEKEKIRNQATHKSETEKINERLKLTDARIARSAVELEMRLKMKWLELLQETQANLEFLRSKMVDVGDEKPGEEFVSLGKKNSKSVFDAAMDVDKGKRKSVREVVRTLRSGTATVDPDAVDISADPSYDSNYDVSS